MATAGTIAEDLLNRHNQLRAEAGKGSVCLNAKLVAAAEKYCQTMASTGHFSHTGRDGSNPGSRIQSEGYSASAWGENIAMGQPNVAEVMQDWKYSSGHYGNIVGPFREVGFAKCGAQSRPYWVATFASPRSRETSCMTTTTTATTPSTTTTTPAPANQDPGLVVYNACKKYTTGWHRDRVTGLYYIQWNNSCYKYDPASASMHMLKLNPEGLYRFHRVR
jgi:hypothetical protein